MEKDEFKETLFFHLRCFGKDGMKYVEKYIKEFGQITNSDNFLDYFKKQIEENYPKERLELFFETLREELKRSSKNITIEIFKEIHDMSPDVYIISEK